MTLAASAHGRADASIEFGMQFWTTIAPGRAEARAQVAAGMESMYRVPFERFERYTPYGTPRELAEFIGPYVEAGARHVNLIATQESPEEVTERAAEVRAVLHEICR